MALGDSVTDGFRSTVDMNQSYPSLLAARLQSNPSTAQVAVLNQGVGGNRLLHDFVGTSGAARFDRDVLVQSGAAYVIVLQGNADLLIPGLIGNPAQVVTVAQLIQGYRQIIERAHAMGLKAYGATLNPVEGYPFPGFWTPELEAKRQAFNQWIRTSNAYDAVIDFDLVLRDPAQPSRLLPAYDSGDHVHPNDDGYRAMAEAIDLALFRDSAVGLKLSLEPGAWSLGDSAASVSHRVQQHIDGHAVTVHRELCPRGDKRFRFGYYGR